MTLSPRQTWIAQIISLLLPGSGQFLLGRRWRGLTICLTALILAFMVNWGLENFQIGQVVLGGITTSWLWLPLGLFWIWNVLDVYRLAA
jgi:hypothetical protein